MKCKTCGEARVTPPLIRLPQEQDPVNWEAKYKELVSQVKKDKEAASGAAAAPVPDPDSDAETETDVEAEDQARLQSELEKVILQFDGKDLPALQLMKKLVTVSKDTENPILTNDEVELEIAKQQKLINELDLSLKNQRVALRQHEETQAVLQKKLTENEDRYKEATAMKDKWLSERLQRHQQELQNKTPDEAPWEKQAAQRKKEKKQAQKTAAANRQRVAESLPQLLQLMEALRASGGVLPTHPTAAAGTPTFGTPVAPSTGTPTSTPVAPSEASTASTPQPTPVAAAAPTPCIDVDMLNADDAKRKLEQEARQAKRAAKAKKDAPATPSSTSGATASSSPAALPSEER